MKRHELELLVRGLLLVLELAGELADELEEARTANRELALELERARELGETFGAYGRR